jgi:single-strand DNA-binding protein
MRTLNSVQLIGRLGRDPEMRYLGSGKPVTTVTLATNSRRKNAAGDWDEETEWHSLVAWDKLAETLNEYGRKGSLLFVSGRLQTRQWEKDGQTHSRTEVVLNELILLDPKGATPATAERVDHLDDDADVPF